MKLLGISSSRDKIRFRVLERDSTVLVPHSRHSPKAGSGRFEAVGGPSGAPPAGMPVRLSRLLGDRNLHLEY